MASNKAHSKSSPAAGQRRPPGSSSKASSKALGAPGQRRPPSSAASQPLPSALLGAGLVIGLYAMLPGFFAAGINLRRSVEVVDHIVPAMVVLALTVLVLLRGAKPDTLMLAAGVVIVLAGFWMVATHIGLAKQGLNHQASAAGAAFHCSTALAVLVLGLAWSWRYRSAGAAAGPPPTGRRSPTSGRGPR